MITPLSIAKTWENTKELKGSENNPIIVGWIHTAGGLWINDDETPWCAAFTFTIAKQCGCELPVRGLGARQWLTVGEPIEFSDACRGWDVVVLSRGGFAPGPEVLSAPGHVGFFNGLSDDVVQVFGGNQNNRVCNAPYPTSRVLGIRRLKQVR